MRLTIISSSLLITNFDLPRCTLLTIYLYLSQLKVTCRFFQPSLLPSPRGIPRSVTCRMRTCPLLSPNTLSLSRRFRTSFFLYIYRCSRMANMANIQNVFSTTLAIAVLTIAKTSCSSVASLSPNHGSRVDIYRGEVRGGTGDGSCFS
jgi:hypothetical protein